MTVDKEQPLLSFSLQTITLFRGTFYEKSGLIRSLCSDVLKKERSLG